MTWSRIDDETFSPDFVDSNAVEGTPPGPEGQRQVMQRLWNAFPDAHFEIEEIAADGDAVIYVGTMSGTTRVRSRACPATGEKVSWRQCNLLRVDNEGR